MRTQLKPAVAKTQQRKPNQVLMVKDPDNLVLLVFCVLISSTLSYHERMATGCL